MKRLAALLAATLVLSLAAPAFAAVEIGGKLDNKFTLHEVADRWQIDGETGLDIETRVTGENGSNIKAVVQLGFEKGYNAKGKLDGSLTFDKFLSDLGLSDLSVKRAWVESSGAYWHGGPEVTTKIGDVGETWDPVIAHFGRQVVNDMGVKKVERDYARGIAVEGVTVGPATLRAFYGWDGADRPMALGASGSVDGVDLSGIVVRKGDENNFAFGVSTALVPGIAVSGKVALDGENRRLYRVEATADNLVEGVKVTAAYRGADDDFAPMYTVAPEDKDGNLLPDPNHPDNIHYDLLDGFSVAAETVQSGVRLRAAYDQPHEMLKLGASTDLYGVTLGYEADIRKGSDVEHTLRAKTVINSIPQLQGLGLYGKVKLAGDDLTWKAKAEYQAPNGLKLGAEYDSVEGPAATAAVTVRF